jgi:hypothetical protein
MACNCEHGFKGKAKMRKDMRTNEGMTRKQARQTTNGNFKIQKGMKKLSGGIVNPAMAGKERPLPNLNPAMNPEQQKVEIAPNPALQAGINNASTEVRERPAPSTNPAMAGESEKPNPAMIGKRERPNPAMEARSEPEVEIQEEVAEDEPQAPAEELPADNNTQNTAPKKKMAWAWIAGGLLALLLIVLLLFYLLRKSS